MLGQNLGRALGLLKLAAQAHHPISCQPQAGVAQISLHSGGALRGLCLAGQRLELFAQLISKVLQAIQIGLHAGELALRFFLAAAVLKHTRGLFDIRAPVLGPRFQDLRKLALADDNVHLAANARIR